MNRIGIDLGTSAMKLLLVDGTGKIERSVSREYPLLFPHPGWSEQDHAHWWNALVSGRTDLRRSTHPRQRNGRARSRARGGVRRGIPKIPQDLPEPQSIL